MTAEEKKKKSKELVSKLHAKFYGKGKPQAQGPMVLAKKHKEPKTGDATSKGASRNELMLKAKAKGIKNFRILNKEELVEILKKGTTKERINELTAGALARWKSGWVSNKSKQKMQK